LREPVAASRQLGKVEHQHAVGERQRRGRAGCAKHGRGGQRDGEVMHAEIVVRDGETALAVRVRDGERSGESAPEQGHWLETPRDRNANDIRQNRELTGAAPKRSGRRCDTDPTVGQLRHAPVDQRRGRFDRERRCQQQRASAESEPAAHV